MRKVEPVRWTVSAATRAAMPPSGLPFALASLKEKGFPSLRRQCVAWVSHVVATASPMPNAQCPMPNAPCPMPHAPCPMPHAPLSNH
ncbi:MULTISPECIES: hypothetical protein [unclassified Tolypothrix]|uniref:hypothetical protein n=1 Tax=unclassified Tolypothrix TaxID=2649714 RepID=UPI0012D747D4|nr:MULTISPECIES: hypothetical protein [unclassified Tolypothrix]UYD33328.1 hypothetical protein HG267_30985 [Tolypothrix sp. PCC 7601]